MTIFGLVIVLVVGVALAGLIDTYANGKTIVCSGYTDSKEKEGKLVAATYPGTCMEIAAGVALVGGRPSWQHVSRADGAVGLVAVLQEDRLQGGTITTQVQAGKRCFVFLPNPGDELNVIVQALSGTSPSVSVGEEFMIDNGTGYLILNSSGAMVPFQALGSYTGADDDSLTWVMCIC